MGDLYPQLGCQRLVSNSTLRAQAHNRSASINKPDGTTTTLIYYAPGGSMLCRVPTASRMDVGTQTGAQLTYDTEGRLTL